MKHYKVTAETAHGTHIFYVRTSSRLALQSAILAESEDLAMDFTSTSIETITADEYENSEAEFIV